MSNGGVTGGRGGYGAGGGAPAAHKTSHENGGADEISVAGLSGALADPQTPAAHTHSGDALGVLTQLDVDNLRLDANTLASTNANGTIILDPNGTGAVQVATGAILQIGGSAVGDLGIKSTHDGFFLLRKADDSDYIDQVIGGVYWVAFGGSFGARLGPTGVELRSDGQILWGDSTDATQAKDAGVKRDSAGVQLDTDGSTGLGKRLTGRVVEANTAGSGAPNLLAATESRKLLTNEGATAENYHTLPSAAAGLEFGFYCQDADGIRIVANTGDTIRNAATVSAAAGFIRCATVGNSITLVAINATEWVVTSIIGTWTIDA